LGLTYKANKKWLFITRHIILVFCFPFSSKVCSMM
jgi:hypothetical protein